MIFGTFSEGVVYFTKKKPEHSLVMTVPHLQHSYKAGQFLDLTSLTFDLNLSKCFSDN